MAVGDWLALIGLLIVAAQLITIPLVVWTARRLGALERAVLRMQEQNSAEHRAAEQHRERQERINSDVESRLRYAESVLQQAHPNVRGLGNP